MTKTAFTDAIFHGVIPLETSNLGNLRATKRLVAMYSDLGSWRAVAKRLGFNHGYLRNVAQGTRKVSPKLSERLRPHRRKTYEENCIEYDQWQPSIQPQVDAQLKLIEDMQHARALKLLKH